LTQNLLKKKNNKKIKIKSKKNSYESNLI